ncbi:MAG: hypothetical protein AAGF11_45120 [Myxococcota bacterium]
MTTRERGSVAGCRALSDVERRVVAASLEASPSEVKVARRGREVSRDDPQVVATSLEAPEHEVKVAG